MKRTIFNRGFTLVELVIVIAVLAIIAGIAIFTVSNVIDNAKRTVAETNAKTLSLQVKLCLTADIPSVDTKKNIIKWTQTTNSCITYNGPTDNSIVDPKGDHDLAKNTLKSLMDGRPIDFGYRMYFTVDSEGTYYFDKIEVFYKNPPKANITSAKPDFTLK